MEDILGRILSAVLRMRCSATSRCLGSNHKNIVNVITILMQLFVVTMPSPSSSSLSSALTVERICDITDGSLRDAKGRYSTLGP